MKTRKRHAWVITWDRRNIAQTPNMPVTAPGSALAVFPGRTSRMVIEGALLGLHQAFASEYPSDMFDYVTKKAYYKPEWNWRGTFCAIGHDPIVKAHYVEDLQLDTRNDEAGKFSWTVVPVGPRPTLN
jgi:hypothetical protein